MTRTSWAALTGGAVFVAALAASYQPAWYALYAVLALAALAVLVQLARAARRVWRLWTVFRFAAAAALIERAAEQLPPDATRVDIHFAPWLDVDNLHMEDTR